MGSHRLLPLLLVTGALLAACSPSVNVTGSAGPASAAVHGGRTGIHKIQHVIIIMQENRSFDTYFGTYPGADGSR